MSLDTSSGMDYLTLITVSFPFRITKVHETESVSRISAVRFGQMGR